jgi:hypothetical protein
MESEENLFEIGIDVNIPVWDIIRYHVYIKYYYPEKDRLKLSTVRAHSSTDYFSLIYNALRFGYKMLFASGDNVIITCSRSLNSNGKYFDKSALPIIETLAGNCIVVEPVLGKKTVYNYLYDFSCVFRRFYRAKPLPFEYYSKFNDALVKHLQKNLISYEEVNRIYHVFQSDYKFYKTLFRRMNTKKLFVATGNPKAILLAAKALGIKTYLLQHAGIEFDEIDYSYPEGISTNSNILFTDSLLTLGEYWCRGINVPAKRIISLGNDFFYSKPSDICDGSILIISTIVHGDELKTLTKQLAASRPDLNLIYKLHPNEYQFNDDYTHYFKSHTNVTILTDQIDISKLIARSQLVVLIVSAVLYEALNQNKKVAVYKKINYKRQLHLVGLPNMYFIDAAEEVSDILSKQLLPVVVDFYKSTDSDMLKKVCLDSTY